VTEDEAKKVLSEVILEQVGPRCRTFDLDDAPDSITRCFVCKTYEALDKLGIEIKDE
jgi:hypothetical protein